MRRLLWVSITLGLAAPFLVPVSGMGAPLSQDIEGTEAELAEVQEREGVLTSELTTLDNQISGLGGEIVALLEELNAGGTTILVITHDRDLAERMPRRIEMRDGAVVADERRR